MALPNIHSYQLASFKKGPYRKLKKIFAKKNRFFFFNMAESEETGLERQPLTALGSVSESPVASDSDGESTSSFEIIEDPKNPSVSRSSLIYIRYSHFSIGLFYHYVVGCSLTLGVPNGFL